MVQLHERKNPASLPELIGGSVVSLTLALRTQCIQFLVPNFFSDLSAFIQLPFSDSLEEELRISNFVHSEQGQRSSEMRFRNPYDKGVLQNVEEFMASKR